MNTRREISLPLDLDAADQLRLQSQIENLTRNHEGCGFVGIWSAARGRSFLALITKGEIASWIMAPAANEDTALRIAAAFAGMISSIADDAAESAATQAADVIRRASMH